MQKRAGRYPPQIAPFAAVASDEKGVIEELEVLVNGGESVYFVGLVPKFTKGWSIESNTSLPQLVCTSQAPVRPGPEPAVLSERHRSDMLALTSLVFPGFFRARTIEMGRYLGVYHGRVLAAMAGERMCIDGYQEISGVCTHPEFIGRGYAQRLVALLTNAALERGVTPFLHVHRENARALSVYQHLGYRQRREIGLWSATRDRQI
jgi:ribosomal protein S18 acetylase RimI-like enzyme